MHAMACNPLFDISRQQAESATWYISGKIIFMCDPFSSCILRLQLVTKAWLFSTFNPFVCIGVNIVLPTWEVI